MKTTDKSNELLAALLEGDADKVRELAPGLTAEEMEAVYFNRDALREPAYKLYQLNGEGHRYYYRFEDGEPVLYPSVTTLLKQTMPTSPFLIKWMMENGDAATEKRDMAAAYGTLMHAEIERLLIGRSYDLDKVPEVVRAYTDRENIADKYAFEWIPKLRKDLLAFAQFAKDYKVQPLAVEISLVHPRYRFAGCIDLPCIITDKKGNTFRAIVDFKSGRKGFYEEHELQLELYRWMWNETYPEAEVERIFNWSPKDWIKSPTYNFKEQTDSPNLAKLPYLLGIAAIEDEKRENNVTFCEGVIDLDGDLSGNYKTISIAELIKTKGERAGEAEPAEAEKPAKAKRTTNKSAKAPKTAK